MAERWIEFAPNASLADAIHATAHRSGDRARSNKSMPPAVVQITDSDGLLSTIDLPPREQFADLLTRQVIEAIRSHSGAAIRSAYLTHLAPAAGVCGPADAGPIDSLRLPHGRRATVMVGDTDVSATVVETQQTRLWLSLVHLHTQDWRGLKPGGLRVLPPVVAQSTALIAEYMIDVAGTRYWDELVLLGEPEFDGTVVQLVIASTEGAWLGRLMSPADVRQAGQRCA